MKMRRIAAIALASTASLVAAQVLADTPAPATNHLLADELGPRLCDHARTLIAAFEWAEYAQLDRLVLTATQSTPDIARRWHDATSSGYVHFLATDMEQAARVARPDKVAWTALANLFLFGISGWYRNELAMGTFTLERFEAYCEVVTDAIVLAANNQGA